MLPFIAIAGILEKIATIVGGVSATISMLKNKRIERKIKKKQEEEMENTKSFLTSKTIWGIVIMAISAVAQRKGITIDEAGVTNDIVTIMGTVLAIWGRFTAEKQISGLLK